MRKVRILGIAPYSQLRYFMEEEAAKYPNVELVAFVADLSQSLSIISQYSQKDFDFILSRGGTATVIRQNCSIPVIEVEVSPLDLLRSLKISTAISDRVAVLGFPALVKNVQFVAALLNADIEVFTLYKEEDVPSLMSQVAERNHTVLLSGHTTSSLAAEYNFRSVLITSGRESVNQAIRRAIENHEMIENILHQNHIYSDILETHPFEVYTLTENSEVLYQPSPRPYTEDILQMIRELVPSVLENGERKVYRKFNGRLLSLSGKLKIIDNEKIIHFYANFRKIPLSLLKNGIQYIDRDDLLEKRSTDFYLTVMKQVAESLPPVLASDDTRPIFLLGERGTEKQSLAETLFLEGKRSTQPFTVIDCARMNRSENWDFLLSSINSPFSDTETTIYIRNIDILKEEKYRELFSAIKATHLNHRNTVIFDMSENAATKHSDRYQFIKNNLNCRVIEIPPLRTVRQFIPQLAGTMIAVLNVTTNYELAGITPEAVRLLQDYDWPTNLTQFYRVLTEAIQRTTEPIIQADDILPVLEAEKAEYTFDEAEDPGDRTDLSLDCSKTLYEINKEIITHVLNEEQGNHSAAARRLGISRTTLWRMLRE